ncbi:MAG: zinc transporter, periplasmic zinc-binding protein ZnuA [Pseudomonadota bacterium]|jgi:zinc transport system substrate-binding protein
MRLASFVLLSLTTPALAEVPVVVTDIPPVHSLVAQVMGDLGAPVLLMDQGADAHDYQMRPSQAAALNDAALLVWIGPEMTPWLDRVVQGGIAGRSVALLDAAGTHVRDFAGGGGHDDHADAGHSHDGADPHAWLDPGNATLWLDVIAVELAAADPENAAAYAGNAAAGKAAVTAAEAQARARLAPVADRQLVVFHDAYGYFFDHFGLAAPLAVAEGDAADPGAARLAEIRGDLSDTTCIFPEAQHDPKLIETLAGDTGAIVGASLDPEGRDLPPGPALYGELILSLATTIGDCVSAP